jgi:glutamyl-tRNA synthetase
VTRVRFAPSPTGSLHLGNARTALFNWLVARKAGGTMILRIEDTDTAREEEGSEAAILEDLRWLGLSWEEGPETGGPHGPYRQSERAALYADAAVRLLAGGRAYRCFCSDEDLAREREAQRAAGIPPRYSGTCRALPEAESARRAEAGEPFAVRFRVLPARPGLADLRVVFEDRLRGRIEVGTAELSDPVLLRRDGRPTYNFAVVVDDAAMGVDLVIRGDDHLSNTPRQVLLFGALGHALPQFAHLPMVLGQDGERLSKRHGATSVAEYRRQGYPPEGLLNALALLGWSPGDERTILTVAELVESFDLTRIGRSPAVFDPVKTAWISAQHVHRMEAGRLQCAVAGRLQEAGLVPTPVPPEAAGWLAGVAEIVRTSVEHLDQTAARLAPLFAAGGEPGEADAREALLAPGAAETLAAFARLLDEGSPDSREAWRGLLERLKAATARSGKALFLPVRVALTAHASGPELDRLVPLVTQGHALFPDRIPSLQERVTSTVSWMEAQRAARG